MDILMIKNPYYDGNGISTTFCVKNDIFTALGKKFSLGQWKYHFFTQKVVEMPHL